MSQPRPLRSTSSPLGSAAESAATVPEPHIRIWHSSKSSLTAPDDRKQIQRAFCKIRPVAGFFTRNLRMKIRPCPLRSHPAVPRYFMAASARFASSSSGTSSTCVLIVHTWPKGSVSVPERSP